MPPAADAEVLCAWFRTLEQQGVSYAVLRNYRSLPVSRQGHDIDVLVQTDQLDRAEAALHQAVQHHSGRLIVRYLRRACILRYSLPTVPACGLPVDLFPALEWRGHDYLSSHTVLACRERHNGIWVLPPCIADLITWLKEGLAHGRDTKGKSDALQKCWEQLPEALMTDLDSYFGSGFSDGLAAAVRGQDPPGRFFKAAGRRLLRQHFRRHPLATVTAMLNNRRQRLLRLWRYPGFVVAVLGVDGAGKSTLIKGLKPGMQDTLHSPMQVEHLRPNLLPSLPSLFGRNSSQGPVTDPHAARPAGTLGSLLRLAYYALDYQLGYWLKVRVQVARHPCLFVFDRYASDYRIDPRRARIRLPEWILKRFAQAAPQPDLVLCLGTDVETMHHRKPELPLAELQRQSILLRELCRQPHAHWIDTGGTAAQSITDAQQHILAAMALRYPQGDDS